MGCEDSVDRDREAIRKALLVPVATAPRPNAPAESGESPSSMPVRGLILMPAGDKECRIHGAVMSQGVESFQWIKYAAQRLLLGSAF